MGKNILVTGGFGFIGSHLVDRLLAQGHNVFVIDNMSSNVVELKDYVGRLAEYPEFSSGLHFAHGQVQDLEPWHYISRDDETMDEIYHLASPVGPVGVLKYSGEIVRQISQTTYAIIDLALRHNAKLVDVSTSEVYGGGQQGLCAEDMPRIIQAETTVRLEYAVAKLAMETAVINLTKTSNLQAVIVRPFNVAGPRQKAEGGFVVPRFVEQALKGERLTVYGDGQQIRAFTHVEDIVDGLLLAMEKGRSGEVYNLGNWNNKTTIEALARIVQNEVALVVMDHVDPKTIHGPLFAEAADKYPSPWKAIEELGWDAKHNLTRIVRDVRDSM